MSKIKILAISDDIRFNSGVGIQLRKLLLGLVSTGRYEIVEMAGSVQPRNVQPTVVNGIKLYPYDMSGNPVHTSQIFKQIFYNENPDIVLAFSDPRFFTWLFAMDYEFRGKAKLVYYHTWDNEPFPKYNVPWYSCCDEVVMLSKFSYNLMQNNGVDCTFIPHGVDASEFYPLSNSERTLKRTNFLTHNKVDADHIIFWNNRNIYRKRPGDIIRWFIEFSEDHPRSCLFMNTKIQDSEGTDLLSVIHDIYPNKKNPILINNNPVSTQELNLFYNLANTTINTSYNEGFGLSVLESLATATPVIATKTGGMTEQMTDGTTVFGKLLEPAVRHLFGVQGSAYIYQDFVSDKDVLDAMDDSYYNRAEWGMLGKKGKDYILENNSISDTITKWDYLLQKTVGSMSKYKRVRFEQLRGVK